MEAMKSQSVLTRSSYELFILASMFILLSHCGDSRTPRDIEVTRKREQISQRLIEIEPLIGSYEGPFLDARTNRHSRLRLNIVQSGKQFNSDNVPDEIVAPTLSASALLYGVDSAENTYTTFSFTRSDYDAKTGALIFYSDDPAGSLFATTTEQDRLVGNWMVNTKGVLGSFDLVKVLR